MPKSAAKSARKSGKKLSRKQVIDKIMKLVASAPEAHAQIPATWATRTYWEKTFSPRNKFAAPVLEVLQELPGFTNLAPRSDRDKD